MLQKVSIVGKKKVKKISYVAMVGCDDLNKY